MCKKISDTFLTLTNFHYGFNDFITTVNNTTSEIYLNDEHKLYTGVISEFLIEEEIQSYSLSAIQFTNKADFYIAGTVHYLNTIISPLYVFPYKKLKSKGIVTIKNTLVQFFVFSFSGHFQTSSY